MLKGILSDNDVRGQFDALIRVCTSESWREVWTSLGLRTYTLEALGMPADAVDAEIWRICQQRELVLVTGNRNAKGEDSLENTIRLLNQPTSLPVSTLADPPAIERDREYAEQVAVRLMELLIDIDNYRGCGRLYLP
jgi:hypothetical protein